MNVSLHKKLFFKRLWSALFFLAGLSAFFSSADIGLAYGQGGPLHYHYYEKVAADTLHLMEFETYHIQQAPEIQIASNNGTAFLINAAGNPSQSGTPGTPGTNQIYYAPNPGFYGYDIFTVTYYTQGPSYIPLGATMVVEVLVVPSFLIAENDYASTYVNQSVTIDVLGNDYGNGTNLEVEALPNTNFGTVVQNADNTVTYTPSTGFSGVGHFNYTICDDEGSCDVATVSICVIEMTPPAYEYIEIFTTRNTPQVVLVPLTGYTLVTPPSNGVMETVGVLEYVPNNNYVGTDQAIYEDFTNNRVRVIDITVLNATTPNIFVLDDIAFTPIDLELSIDVLANDKGGLNLNNVSAVSQPAHGSLSQDSKGVYTYEPDAGFVGVDQFVYKASAVPGGTSEYGTVYLVVHDHNPELPVYQLSTPKNTPLVITYNIPIEDFDFANWSAADHGTINYYAGEQTVATTYGQEVSGYNMLIYTPAQDEVNVTDEFEFEYCVAGNTTNCQEVKLIVDIVEVTAPIDTLCAGQECVWTGDANHDGSVDIRDLLPIGLCMGEVGSQRPNAALQWYGQYANNWNSIFETAPFDIKHVDTDGDGIVGAIDTTAIKTFYNKHHTVTPEPFQSATHDLLFIEELAINPDSLEPGDVFVANIHLGDSLHPVLDAYGLAFHLDYDPALFESVTVTFNDHNWMSYNSPVLSMKHQPFEDRLDVGYTRTSGVAASGFGIIGQAEFIITDDLVSFRPQDNKTTISLSPFGMMNGAGQTSAINGDDLTVYFDFNEENDKTEETTDLSLIEDHQLQVYPNPAIDKINLHLNGADNEIEKVVVYTAAGQEVLASGAMQRKRTQLDVSSLETGLYLVKVWTNSGMISRKFTKL